MPKGGGSASSADVGYILKSNEITVGKKIGEGASGTVYEGYWGPANAVAIKQLPETTLTDDDIRTLNDEARIMAKLNNPSIVRFFGFTDESPYRIVMELMGGGSLYEALQRKPHPDWSKRIGWAINIAEGIKYLHSRHIIHRDIKSPNVLLTGDQEHAKLADFGLAIMQRIKTITSTLTRSSEKKDLVGTLRWMAPELLTLSPNYTKKTDIFAYGIVLWEIAACQLPYPRVKDETLIIGLVKSGERAEVDPKWPEVFSNLLKQCWAKEPEDRPEITDEFIQKLLSEKKVVEAAQLAPWQRPTGHKSDPKDGQSFRLEPGGQRDYDVVLGRYNISPVPGYTVRRVDLIVNPHLEKAFETAVELLQKRSDQVAFDPAWKTENNSEHLEHRTKIDKQLREMTAPYADSRYPDVQFFPGFHGSHKAASESICTTGFANLAKTDPGFFGKGLYSTPNAEYAVRVYMKKEGGVLFFTWTCIYSAFPVMMSDIPSLIGKGNHHNYDAHIIPVVPKNSNNPNECNYLPAAKDQKPKYWEMVTFQGSHMLPYCIVHLGPEPDPRNSIMPLTPSSPEEKPKAKATLTPDELKNLFSKMSETSIESESKSKPTPIPPDKLKALLGATKLKALLGATPKNSPQQSTPTNPSTTQKPTKTPTFFSPAEAAGAGAGAATSTKTTPTTKHSYFTTESCTPDFLRAVVHGDQETAEKMLFEKPDLAKAYGKVTDYSERTFEKITGFQYALWALDWRMWEMIAVFLTPDEISSQIKAHEDCRTQPRKHYGIRYGVHHNFTPLFEKLDSFIRHFEQWKQEENNLNIKSAWISGVGRLQEQLPAHMAQELCRTDTSPEHFNLTSKNMHRTLKLWHKQLKKWTVFFPLIEDDLGHTYAIVRGKLPKPTATESPEDLDDVVLDYYVLRDIVSEREAQYEQLRANHIQEKTDSTKTPGPAP